ncbi:MAG: hypothetical protein ACM31C_11765 [Acidobacteriota bacterium]
MKTARSWGCPLVVVCSLAAPALAQSPEPEAQAQALFDEGRKLFEDGDIAAACDKFEASDTLDPSVGTELNLGKCRETNGQTATAWAAFRKAAASAKHHGDDKREAEADKRARALEKRLVRLTIHVPADSDVDGLVIEQNGTPIPRGGWNDPVPVDPDEYTITAAAPGRKPWSETVIVRAKDKTVEVPELEREHHAHKKREPEHRATPNKYRGLTIALAGFGIGAAGIATGFAIYSENVENRADVICPMVQCADAHAVDLNHTAQLDGWIANVGWAIGGASLAGAGLAWWLGTSDSEAAVSIVPVVAGDRTGVAVGGRF